MGKRKRARTSERSSRDSNIAFGAVLRRIRIERGLTQEQLAWNIEMSRVYLSELERGLREPCLGTILKLAQALATNPGALLDEIAPLD